MSEKIPNAHSWIDGQISLGKLIETAGLKDSFAQASDFAGGIANAYMEKAANAQMAIQGRIDRAERDAIVAGKEGSAIDAVAEKARIRAFREALQDLRLQGLLK
jgi:hypothetical protein